MAAKLGMGRCYIVRPSPETLVQKQKPPQPQLPSTTTPSPATPAPPPPPPLLSAASPKDANEALVRGFDLSVLLAGAAPKRHDQIVSFPELRGAVMREVRRELTVESTCFDGMEERLSL